MTGRRVRGQAMVMFALVIPLILLPLAGFAVEGGLLAERQARVAEVCARAAEDAAQQVDAAQFHAGHGVHLDAAPAQSAALAVLKREDPAAVMDSVVIDGDTVTVSAHEVVSLRLALWGSPQLDVRARVSAHLVTGYASPV